MASAFRVIFFSFILLWSFGARVAASPLEEADAAIGNGDLATAITAALKANPQLADELHKLICRRQ
jgi:hypothetical protein